MREKFRFLFSKTFYLYFGLIIFSILLWFLLPLIEVSGKEPFLEGVSRVVVILFISITFIGCHLGLLAKQNSKNRKLLDELSSKDSIDEKIASEEEIKRMNQRFISATDKLKKIKLSGKKNIQKLPWYLVIGAPGSGKTTALLNSGLNFPLGDSMGYDPIQGVGGTKDLDFWFSESAVLVDTAGRFTTQDSYKQVDSSGWHGFLNLLKKYRPFKPVNGIIVTVSASDLIGLTDSQQENHINSIKSRLSEIYDSFNKEIPIYVMLTKIDLIKGFREFFAIYSQKERGIPWGFTLPIKSESNISFSIGKNFDKEISKIIHSLENSLVSRLNKERNNRNRGEIIGFPKQFDIILKRFEKILNPIFGENIYQKSLFLRGVFLCSGTQTGNPIDLVFSKLSSYTKNLNLPNSDKKASYFLNGIFRNIIFKEQNLLSSSSILNKFYSIIYTGGYGLSLIFVLFFCTTLMLSASKSSSAIDNINTKLAEFETIEKESIGILDISNFLTTLENLKNEYSDVIYSKLSGLSQKEKITDEIDELYFESLKNSFVIGLRSILSGEIEKGINNKNYSKVYSSLKIYLMLTEHPNKIEKSKIVNWYDSFFIEIEEPLFTGDVKSQFNIHLETYIDMRISSKIGLTANSDLVNKARKVLLNIQSAERTYLHFISAYGNNSEYKIIESDLFDNSYQNLFIKKQNNGYSEVWGEFTYVGYRNLFLPFLKEKVDKSEKWITGYESEKISINNKEHIDAVKKIYFREYIKSWNKLIGSYSIRPIMSSSDGMKRLQEITNESSAMVQMLNIIYKNVFLSIPKSTIKILEQMSNDKKIAFQKSILRKFPKGKLTPVGIQFYPLLRFHLSKVPNRRFDKINSSLNQLESEFIKLEEQDNSEEFAFKSLTKYLKGQNHPLRSLSSSNKSTFYPLNIWMKKIKRDSLDVLGYKVSEYIKGMWLDNREECVSNILGKYPIGSRHSESIGLDSFSEFFKPGGIFDRFYKKNISNFVIQRNARFKWKINLGFSPGVLKDIRLAYLIKKAYFNGNTKKMAVKFRLKPKYLTHKSSFFSLVFGKNELIYQHGPTRFQTYTWPGQGDTSYSAFSFFRTNGEVTIKQEVVDDSWSFLKLISNKISKSSRNRRFVVKSQKDGLEGRIELLADSNINPWSIGNISSFNCLQSLQ